MLLSRVPRVRLLHSLTVGSISVVRHENILVSFLISPLILHDRLLSPAFNPKGNTPSSTGLLRTLLRDERAPLHIAMDSLDILAATHTQMGRAIPQRGQSVVFLLWSLAYVLMTRRSLATKSYGMPVLALIINLSWEIINLFYVCKMPLKKIGLIM